MTCDCMCCLLGICDEEIAEVEITRNGRSTLYPLGAVDAHRLMHLFAALEECCSPGLSHW